MRWSGANARRKRRVPGTTAEAQPKGKKNGPEGPFSLSVPAAPDQACFFDAADL
jgi:hypothetical protein